MDVNNLVFVSDTHIASRLGLCWPNGMQLDDGGVAMPSRLQLIVWEWWCEFWDVWVPEVCRGEPYGIVFNGDIIDGIHHNDTTQMSANLEDQSELAYQIMKPRVEAAEGRYYHIRGTESHVGPSAREEERLAKRLGAIPNEEGQHARWELWVNLGKYLVHAMHHIGTSGSMAYETSAIQKELEQSFVESARWDDEPPDVLVRSHRHRNAETRIQTRKGFATSCTTAGWQLKTPYVYRIAGARQTQPQIGGTVVRCGDEDIYTRHKLWKIERPKAETIPSPTKNG